MSDTLKRTFDLEVTEKNGRTIEALCVPFNVPTQVADPPDFTPYTEMFAYGAFDRAVKAPNRVWLNFEHQPGFSNVIGNGVQFEQRTDGLYGMLEVDEGQDGDKALRFIDKKILSSMSVEFKPMSRDAQVDGVVTRKSVHHDAVALCRVGAYAEAQVLAVRKDPLIGEYLPFDTELAEKLSARGLKVPYSLGGTTT